MENLRQWAILLCSVSVTSGILAAILPDGKIKRSANIVFSLFFLAVIISIFGKADLFDIKFYLNDGIINTYAYDFDSFIQEEANDITVNEIESVLQEICSEDFTVNVHWENSENIYTLKNMQITVSSVDAEHIDTIKSRVGSLTGVIPEVVLKNEG